MLRAAWVLLAFWLLCGCPASRGSDAQPAQRPALAPHATTAGTQAQAGAKVVLMPAGRDPVSVRVELARTEAERRRGLMFRQSMPQDAGMLFLFDRPEQLAFWMRNTYIALDMIFIEPSMRVLGIVENTEPMTDTSRLVPGISQYVLEVNAGFSRRYGLTAGTAVRFEGVALKAEEPAP
jgi:uncharacterized membrane protein (UPF0127 family)